MRAFPWIVTGVGVGFATYIVFTRLQRQDPTGSDDIENAARRTFFWGTKQRVAGSGGRVAGKVKEGLGRLMGDDDLAEEGIAEKTVGTVRDAAGTVAHAVGETIHDLNR
jgi:uncharacterized protein YjbJ (UPF0337 family)